MMLRPQKILAIVGPTAVGKSALAVRLARQFNGEVISADSRQVYRGLDIGAGKITRREMHGVPHHLLDVASPRQQFNVAEYQRLARKKIEEIVSRGKLPIICGGTGHYIDAALGRIEIPEVPPDPTLRKKLGTKSTKQLFTLLKKLDPRRTKTIDPRNPRRLIRAIEIAKKLGRSPRYADVLKNISIAGTLFIGPAVPPEKLKKRIALRLRTRLKKGMLAEAARLHRRGLSWKRMEELGLEYRYISRYLRGLMTKEEMVEKLKTEIWHYAKRQIVWFKRNKEIKWFSPREIGKIGERVKRFLRH